MPCDYKKYPDNWKAIVKAILSRAGNKCELCYAPNHERVCRGSARTSEYPWYRPMMDRNQGTSTKIILTVHHIDADLKNNSPNNLIALCQRCHLKLDMAIHLKKRRINADQKSKIDAR